MSTPFMLSFRFLHFLCDQSNERKSRTSTNTESESFINQRHSSPSKIPFEGKDKKKTDSYIPLRDIL